MDRKAKIGLATAIIAIAGAGAWFSMRVSPGPSVPKSKGWRNVREFGPPHSHGTFDSGENAKEERQKAERLEAAKKNCEKLVDGQLLFEPFQKMHQGESYSVFARLSRNSAINISQGLEGSQYVILKETVSCKVSMNLDSEEPRAFTIENMPSGRKDDQLLEPDKFSQWDWRVTPKKHGPLHLLLYVTPLLSFDGVGEGLKHFRQPARVITVTPDYLYESSVFAQDNWGILGGLLTAVVIPIFLWFRTGIVDWFQKRFKKKEVFYELPRKKGTS